MLASNIGIARKSVQAALESLAKKKKKDKKPSSAHKKAKEIADAIRRDDKSVSDEAAYRMAWETVCSYTHKGHSKCTQKGKSKRKSPKKDR